VRRKLHHRVLRRVGGRRGLVLGMGVGVGVGAEGGSERASDWADLVALPADGGERVDHAVDAVDLAHEVRRVIVAAGRRRAHPRFERSCAAPICFGAPVPSPSRAN
jgi:hypothetical protein